jgi:predicted N-acetyltransferase YhbS
MPEVRQVVTNADTGAHLLFEGAGYVVHHTSWILEMRLEDAPPEVVVPSGIAIRAYRPEDGEAAYHVTEDAFNEWPGRQPTEFAGWSAHVLAHAAFAPDLSRLAFDGDELVGAALCLDYEGQDEGWVQQLATKGTHRHRGIARALLQSVFAAYHASGRRLVGLSTDSRTGALTLYERIGMRVRRTYTSWAKDLGEEERPMDAGTAESLLSFAEEASQRSRGPDGKAALKQLEERCDDLVAALAWLAHHRRADEALRLANALYRFWITKQRFEEGELWFDRALGAPGGQARLRGQASNYAGFMPFWLGQDDRAAAHFGRGLEIGRELDDPAMISQALGGLARVALRTDVAEGRRLAGEALAVSQDAADEAGLSNALHLLGVGAQIAGDLPEARDWMTRRLAVVRSTGNEFLIASEASNLSMVERQLGNLDAAEALAREALAICERVGDQFTRPFAISGLAAIATDRHEFSRAATLVGAAEAIMEAQHMAWPPDERPHYERMLAVLPESLGSAEFDRTRAVGRAMPPSQAVRFALDPGSAPTA